MSNDDENTYLDMPATGHAHDSEGKTVSHRKFTHREHAVEIESTYRIKIDGVTRNAHFIIGEDGRATTHMMPYQSYASLVELVCDLIDKFPDEFGGGDDA